MTGSEQQELVSLQKAVITLELIVIVEQEVKARFTINYLELTQVTRNSEKLFQSIDSCLDVMNGAQSFTVMDILSRGDR